MTISWGMFESYFLVSAVGIHYTQSHQTISDSELLRVAKKKLRIHWVIVSKGLVECNRFQLACLLQLVTPPPDFLRAQSSCSSSGYSVTQETVLKTKLLHDVNWVTARPTQNKKVNMPQHVLWRHGFQHFLSERGQRVIQTKCWSDHRTASEAPSPHTSNTKFDVLALTINFLILTVWQ